ncbi:lamin tail domain-containing protein [Archangium gephyra]|uniref:putative Ig domain-containing protein n=1 Tax=Archangium gephyra TaxID=48 RepID=UPI0035D40482
MPFARLLGTLAVLALLGACPGPTPAGNEPLQLPDLEQLETTEGVPFEVSLAATGGTPPLRHSLEKLPPGLFFSTGDGVLKGTASIPGTYSFTEQVKDAAGAVEARTYRLLVHPTPAITTTSLPLATQGETYAVQLEASGGQAPLRWTLVGGALPTGLSLGEDGLLTGVPRESGSYSPTVRAQDVHGAQASRMLGLVVRPGTLDGGADGGGGGDGGTDGGTPLAFSAANWNLEWFGYASDGPTDDALQLENVKTVVSTTGADFWGLQELVDAAEFDALKQLPGYDGFMANDPRVVSGASYYSVSEQKVGILFRSDVVSVLDARIILTSSNYDFGTRPPLQVKLRITRNGTSVDLVAIVLHMKALSDTDSYNRRKNAALALKGYLDALPEDTRFIVLGDWNDDVDVSITRDSTSGTNLPTPYQNFLDDPADYSFLTQPLSLTNVRSTVSNSQFIDHQLVSNELRASYVSNSAQALRPDAYISQYKSTTSDHYPVLSRFTFNVAPPPPPPLRVTSPNGGEQLASSTVQTVTWTADGVSTVLLELSLDNGATWQVLAPSVPASSGQYTWTVPPVAATTAQARVRVSDASAPATSDQSDTAFTVSWPPPVFINEYLPHEPPVPGGTARDFAQQFVEVVNGSTTSTVDLGGWLVNDLSAYTGTSPRHTFAAGTLLGPGKSVVVYSGASTIPAGATNAVAASSGGLFFNKGTNNGGSGDDVYLQNGAKQVVDSTRYTESTEAVSYNRSPDATPTGAFGLHNLLNPSLGSSPGRRVDGSNF